MLCLFSAWLSGQQTAAQPNKSLGDTRLPEKRRALVIGIRNYDVISPLKNPLNDADAMTAVLKRLGFSVDTVKNANNQTFNRAITDFTATLDANTVALFYFSGHGVSYNGKNYLLPGDARIDCIEHIESEGVNLDKILNGFEFRRVKNGIAFLDACRDLPKLPACHNSSRNLNNKGLVIPANQPRGTFISFATREGRTANDNPNESNGLFTKALLKYLMIPDLSLRAIMDSTAIEVEKQSSDYQTPGRYDEMRGDFYFIKKGIIPSPPPRESDKIRTDAEKLPLHFRVSGSTPKVIYLPTAESVMVKASGTMVIGRALGNSTPDGRPSGLFGLSLAEYNIARHINHAGLMYRLKGESEWKFCGSQCVIRKNKHEPYLEILFQINDRQTSDNEGGYDVEIDFEKE